MTAQGTVISAQRCLRALGHLSIVLHTLIMCHGQRANPTALRRDSKDNYMIWSREGPVYLSSPVRSYVIYDRDINSLPDDTNRPKIFYQPQPWHLQFNSLQNSQMGKTHVPDAVSHFTVSSNLIQILDEPSQKQYFGPFGGKGYSSNRYPDFSRPVDVPKYEVVYPYAQKESSVYGSVALPDHFPSPFSPNVNFRLVEPAAVNTPRRNFGLYSTDTINYMSDSENRRSGSKDMCNFIRLNNKGFPTGNELCGRTVSDILLSESYPTTGELVLEHRKQYRGAYSPRRSNSQSQRRKRSANEYRLQTYGSSTYGSPTSYLPKSCCFDSSGGSYSNREYDGQRAINSFGYDNQRFGAGEGYRIGGRYDGSYGYPQRGHAYDNEDDIRGDTTNNRGLTSYLANRGRDRFNDDSEEDDSGDREYRKDGQSKGSGGDSKRKDKGGGSYNSRNSTKNGQRNQNRDRKYNGRRGNDNYDDDEDNDSSNRNGGNNYGYVKSYNNDRNRDSGYSSGGGRRGQDSRVGYGYNDGGSRGQSSGGYGDSGGYYGLRGDSSSRESYGGSPYYNRNEGSGRYNGNSWYGSSGGSDFNRGSSGYGYNYKR